VQISHQGTLDIYNGDDTQVARRTIPSELHERAGKLLDRVNAAAKPTDLATPRGNRLEKLLGNREGEWSIRINDQYRICFAWDDGQAVNVRIEDYH
jgi:toxin HigB-1